jgi:hypothetical protein
MRVRMTVLWLLGIGFGLAGPAWAQGDAATTTSSGSPSFGYRGWGPRVGVAADPDQVVAGVHFALGGFTQDIGLRPDIVVGFGDDTLSLVASVPVWYRFLPGSEVRPYAGGAVALGLFRVDTPQGGDETDFEIGLQIGGGGEWKLKGGGAFHAELRLDLLDVWDVAVFVGWTF